MKLILLQLFGFIFVLTIISSKLSMKKSSSHTSKSGSKNKKTSSKVTSKANLPDDVTFGFASNDNILQNASDFKDPIYMEKIPIHLNNPYTGVMANANGFITDKFYYNGRDNLNAIHINCNVYSTQPSACVHNMKCGWCGQSNTCIAGSQSGPLASCLRSTFLYSAPSSDWNPLKAPAVNILAVNQKGESQTTIVPEPTLGNVNIYQPYN